MFGFNSLNKIYFHEYDGRMSHYFKRAINSKVMDLETWGGIPKSQKRGGKLKDPSQDHNF